MPARTAPGWLGQRLIDLNRRPFGRTEAAFYEFVAAPAVARIVVPVLRGHLRSADTGPVLDVGCGGGAIASTLRDAGHVVVPVDPSVPQLQRLGRRARLPATAASAGALPFTTGRFASVVSSCAIKHWPNRVEGLAECARVLRPGGVLVLVEIDGGQDESELPRFATHTRIPPGLRRLYPPFARRSFVPVSPTAEDIAADCRTVGLTDLRHQRIDGLPFFVVTATGGPR